MADLLKTMAILALLVILIRRKWNLGMAMIVGAVILAIIYLTPPLRFLDAVLAATVSRSSVEMTTILIFTMIMENILRQTGSLKRMIESLFRLLPDSRLIMAAMPAMIGMLPSPGGAVFSAPMVGEASQGVAMPADQKAFVNYWYRHIWEYVSPLYPGIILVSALTRIPFNRLALANAPFALSVVFWGAIFCFAGVGAARRPVDKGKGHAEALWGFTITSAPIFVTLLLVVNLKVNPVLAMGGMVVVLYLAHRYSPAAIFTSLRESVSVKALILVVGIMIFQETLRVTGALDGISHFFATSGLPVLLILPVIPFIAGVITGLTIAYVGITFPLLMPLMGGDTPSLGLVSLAFAGGFAGVMLSPVHLCLLLTRDYFEADFGKIYRRMLLPQALVFGAALIPLMVFGWT